jgi:hypothetical protein
MAKKIRFIRKSVFHSIYCPRFFDLSRFTVHPSDFQDVDQVSRMAGQLKLRKPMKMVAKIEKSLLNMTKWHLSIGHLIKAINYFLFFKEIKRKILC